MPWVREKCVDTNGDKPHGELTAERFFLRSDPVMDPPGHARRWPIRTWNPFVSAIFNASQVWKKTRVYGIRSVVSVDSFFWSFATE